MAAIYRVEGMTCQGCANSVSRAIETQTGATRALVDLTAGTVSVEGQVSEAEVRSAIEAAGFDFKGTV